MRGVLWPVLLLPLGLAVLPCAGNTVALAQQAADTSAAEITFWNSVKDSTDPEELRAYLDAFPQGKFAALARIRLNKLDLARLAKPAAPGTPTLQLNEQIIKEVQERLYNLNYPITSISGKLTPEVTEAIRAFQGKLGEAMTGELTETQLAKLRQVEPSKAWGAIAAVKGGRFESISQMPTRRDAEARVLLGCRTSGSPDCKIFSVAGKQCAVAASFTVQGEGEKSAVRISISRQNGLSTAELAALAACNKQPQSQGRCQIVSRLCADGSHGSQARPQREGSLSQRGPRISAGAA
jgi:peptidoglycan hydrolase-like protein with peptidoglycan-binding domain